ncbi:MAG: GAF and ANTAR domain-containing protein [Actinomycetota bacterium]|nr:GAF and ANTAR domain-containing protein [Actinomycetota bacterium]
MDREAQLSQVFVELADTLVADFDVADFLHTLTRRCVALFDVDAVGLMLADLRGDLRVVAASAEQIELLELFELQSEEGPCVDSYRSGDAVMATDLLEAEKWPRFGPETLTAGYRAVQALPLRLRGQVIGALNLFRVEPGGLRGHELQVCQAIADVATIGLLQARALRESQVLANQLSAALNSRVVIEQAKGVLAERTGVDMETAFRLLRSHARDRNRRLAEVARDVVERRLDLR